MALQVQYEIAVYISGDIWQSRQMPFQRQWKKKQKPKRLKALLFGFLKSCGVGSILYSNVICWHKGHGKTSPWGDFWGDSFLCCTFSPLCLSVSKRSGGVLREKRPKPRMSNINSVFISKAGEKSLAWVNVATEAWLQIHFKEVCNYMQPVLMHKGYMKTLKTVPPTF